MQVLKKRLFTLSSFCLLLSISCALSAQEINIYSEFQRFDPFGSVLPADREIRPREILSPAVPRNGHLTVHVIVTAPAHTNYFLYTESNPPDIVQIRLYREHFTHCQTGYCPDWLTEQKSPAFGAMPESTRDIPTQTARAYLIDIWVPPDATPRRVRIEALLKTGIWMVAPMELRIIAPVVPAGSAVLVREDVAPVESQSAITAQRQLQRYLGGLPPEIPAGILRVRDAIQRNAAEDMLIAGAAALRSPELTFGAWSPPGTGAEWYLRVRDFIYRSVQTRTPQGR